MDGIWQNGRFVLASTLEDREARLRKEHQAMKEALEDLLKAVHAAGFHKDIKQSFSLRVAAVQAEKALTLANGGKPDA